MNTRTEPIAYWDAVQRLIAAVRSAEVTTLAIEQALDALESPDLSAERHRLGVRGLVALMSNISEEHYSAGWLTWNEHYLWECMQHPEIAYCSMPLDAETITDLRTAAQTLGGWVRWVGAPTHDAVFIPLAEWEPLHTAWLAACARERAEWAALKQAHPELFTWPDPISAEGGVTPDATT
jgi:hypothetical protein